MSHVIICLFSFTRCIARRLRKHGILDGFRAIIVWNSPFYVCSALSVSAALLTQKYTYQIPTWCLWAVLFVTVSRIDELVFAFYGDAIANKSRNREGRLPIDARERMILLTLGYLEAVVQFGIVYYIVQNLAGSGAFNKVVGVGDALYLSGLTITTTGYGDIYPNSPWARLASVGEALVGIVFIAMALAAYMGDKDDKLSEPSSPSSEPR